MSRAKPERCPRWRLVRGWLITLGVLAGAAGAITVAMILNAPETPPPSPPGTNVVLTTRGTGPGRPQPDLPAGLQSAGSGEVNKCWVSLSTDIAAITTDSVSTYVYQGTRNVRTFSDDNSPPIVLSGPNQNRWSETYELDRAKVGHTYRHGPVLIEVLGVWESPKHEHDKRGYLRVTFDESKIVCPPLPADTVEEPTPAG